MNKKIKFFIEEFIKGNKTLIFIETGTFYGTTSEWASKLFKVVYTIEKETHFFQAAEKKFNNTNVNCINGASSTCLSSILKNIDDTVIFWLDAHWSCEDTSGEEKECPLLEEISIINKWNRDCVILIDDASDFLCSPPKPHKPDHWPSISEVINKLNDISSDRFIVVIHDVIIAVPESYKNIIQNYCIREKAELRNKKQINENVYYINHLKKSLYHLKRFIVNTFIKI